MLHDLSGMENIFSGEMRENKMIYVSTTEARWSAMCKWEQVTRRLFKNIKSVNAPFIIHFMSQRD